MMPFDQPEWEDWASVSGLQQHRDRFPLIRVVRYELSESFGNGGSGSTRSGGALTVNVGNGGLCLLMDWSPDIQEVMLVQVPMPENLAQTPTLAEVRWVRPLPFERGVYLVGLKFVL